MEDSDGLDEYDSQGYSTWGEDGQHGDGNSVNAWGSGMADPLQRRHPFNSSENNDDDEEYSLQAFQQKLDRLTESLENGVDIERVMLEARQATTFRSASVTSESNRDAVARHHPFDDSDIGSRESVNMEGTPVRSRLAADKGSVNGEFENGTDPYFSNDQSLFGAAAAADSTTATTTRTPRKVDDDDYRSHTSMAASASAATPEPPTPVKTPVRQDFRNSNTNSRSRLDGDDHPTFGTSTSLFGRPPPPAQERGNATTSASASSATAADAAPSRTIFHTSSASPAHQQAHASRSAPSRGVTSSYAASSSSFIGHGRGDGATAAGTSADDPRRRSVASNASTTSETFNPSSARRDATGQSSVPPSTQRDDTLQDLTRLVEQLRGTIGRHESRIQHLEEENEYWRRYRLVRMHTDRTSTIASRTSAATRSNSSNNSPGVRFVAELAQVMDIAPENYAPLSRIMDLQLERLVLEDRRRRQSLR